MCCGKCWFVDANQVSNSVHLIWISEGTKYAQKGRHERVRLEINFLVDFSPDLNLLQQNNIATLT